MDGERCQETREGIRKKIVESNGGFRIPGDRLPRPKTTTAASSEAAAADEKHDWKRRFRLQEAIDADAAGSKKKEELQDQYAQGRGDQSEERDYADMSATRKPDWLMRLPYWLTPLKPGTSFGTQWSKPQEPQAVEGSGPSKKAIGGILDEVEVDSNLPAGTDP